MIDRGDVVEHLLHVAAVVSLALVGLEQDEIGQRRLGALDPAGEDRFPAEQRAGKQVRVRQRAPRAGQEPERPVGRGEPADQVQVQREVGWERRG